MSERIEKIAESFVARFSPATDKNLLYELDGSWTSVAVLDLIVEPIKYKEEFDREDLSIIEGISAYLALIARDCWAELGAKVSLSSGSSGIEIVAESGPKIAVGEKCGIKIEQALIKLLSEFKPQIEVINRYKRTVSPYNEVIHLFALGLFTGLSPFCEGPWKNQNYDSFSEEVDKVEKVLALTVAKSYQKIYPDEPLGALPELYLGGLILPPLLMSESAPALGGVKRLEAFFEEYNFKPERILSLFGNLLTFGAETIGLSSFAAFSAFIKGELNAPILAIAESKGFQVTLLRPAMVHMRDKIFGKDDWLEAEELISNDLTRIKLEYDLGYFPWVNIPAKRFIEPELRSFLKFVAALDLAKSEDEVEYLIKDAPSDLDFRMQRIHFHILRSDLEQAERELRNLLSEVGANKDPRVYDSLAFCCLNQGDTKQAIKYQKQAYNIHDVNNEAHIGILNNYAWLLIQEGDLKTAEQIIEQVIKRSKKKLTPFINLYGIYRMTDRHEQAEGIEDNLVQYAPFDSRVFAIMSNRVI